MRSLDGIITDETKKQRPRTSIEEVASFHKAMLNSFAVSARKKNFAAADMIDFLLLMDSLETKRADP